MKSVVKLFSGQIQEFFPNQFPLFDLKWFRDHDWSVHFMSLSTNQRSEFRWANEKQEINGLSFDERVYYGKMSNFENLFCIARLNDRKSIKDYFDRIIFESPTTRCVGENVGPSLSLSLGNRFLHKFSSMRTKMPKSLLKILNTVASCDGIP